MDGPTVPSAFCGAVWPQDVWPSRGGLWASRQGGRQAHLHTPATEKQGGWWVLGTRLGLELYYTHCSRPSLPPPSWLLMGNPQTTPSLICLSHTTRKNITNPTPSRTVLRTKWNGCD